jgi:hypothetical protein
MMKKRSHRFCQSADIALEKIEEAIRALEQCQGKLAPEEYKALRARSGHLMDTLYHVGDALCRTT